MNTTETGDTFRDQIADLLIVAGYDVDVEILEGHKRVDIRFTDRSFGKNHIFALEAKNWEEPLNHGDLEKIYGGYASLLARHDVDHLLVVSKMPLRSPAAKAFIRDTPRIIHQSFLEFQESIMQCSGFLKEFLRTHAAEGLEDYYVNQFIERVRRLENTSSYGGAQTDTVDLITQANSSERLDSFVDNWLKQDIGEQLAIVAGYGMGKTSFATHITYTMATRYLQGENCRVPILLRLGSLSREQSVEGLLGSTLAGAGPNIRNYNYKLFDALNRAGRFLLILDGFDEMKHLMSRSEFRSAFDQLNRLSTGKAKVILMGRPSAFISDKERAFFLSGLDKIDKQWLRMPGSPIYLELNLRRFNRDQITDFISRFLSSNAVKTRISIGNSSRVNQKAL